MTGAGGGGYGTGNRMLRDSGGPTVLPPPLVEKMGRIQVYLVYGKCSNKQEVLIYPDP